MSNFQKYLNKIRKNYNESDMDIVSTPMVLEDHLSTINKLLSKIGNNIIGIPGQILKGLTKNNTENVMLEIIEGFHENLVKTTVEASQKLFDESKNAKDKKISDKLKYESNKMRDFGDELNEIELPKTVTRLA